MRRCWKPETGRRHRRRKGPSQVFDTGEIEAIIDKVIADSPEQLAAYKAGKENVFRYFVGQVMKATGGKVCPIGADVRHDASRRSHYLDREEGRRARSTIQKLEHDRSPQRRREQELRTEGKEEDSGYASSCLQPERQFEEEIDNIEHAGDSRNAAEHQRSWNVIRRTLPIIPLNKPFPCVATPGPFWPRVRRPR